MGVHPAPSKAYIYLARRVDSEIVKIAEKYLKNGSLKMELFKRFLYDIIQLFFGTTKQLHNVFDKINQIHPTLKFTMTHTSVEKKVSEDRCSCKETKSIPFLDTSLSIQNG